MKCPVCKTTDLLMTERRSIEIDYCPHCRGVWLDRGELDKLIAQDAARRPTRRAAARAGRDDRRDREPCVRQRPPSRLRRSSDGVSSAQKEALDFRCVRFRLNAPSASALYRARLYRRLRRAAFLYPWARRRRSSAPSTTTCRRKTETASDTPATTRASARATGARGCSN